MSMIRASTELINLVKKARAKLLLKGIETNNHEDGLIQVLKNFLMKDEKQIFDRLNYYVSMVNKGKIRPEIAMNEITDMINQYWDEEASST